MKTQPLKFEQFAGLNADAQPLLATLRDGKLAASTATNVYIDQRSGEVKKCAGSSKLHTTAPSSDHPSIALFEYLHSDGRRDWIVRTTREYLRNGADTGGAWARMAFVWDMPRYPSWAQIGNYLVIVDGQFAYYWDGESDKFTDWRTVTGPQQIVLVGGHYPNIEAVAEFGGALTVDSTYEVIFTFYNGLVESPPSEAMSLRIENDTNDTIRVHTGYAYGGDAGEGTGLRAVPAGVTHVRFYMSAADTPGVWYRNATWDVDVIEDGDAGDEITADLDDDVTTNEYTEFGGPPAGASFVSAHAERAFVSGAEGYPNRIWWTPAGFPVKFDATNWLNVGESDDPIIAHISMPLATPMLAILKADSVWVLSGYDDTTFVGGLRQVASGPGCLAPHAVMAVGPHVYFWGSGGIYRFDGEMVEPIDHGIRNRFLTDIGVAGS
ncbi:MAG TPA: hypothetical protein VM487_05275 [Phycisphaerae bacterium]|nr:hypothetical protein [Phycisphaerae bacterium]